jgi:hypothetical protein
MKHGVMRFMGYTLHHNPHTLQVISNANLSQYFIPEFTEVTESMGDKATVVKGEGAFYGDNAFEQFAELKQLSKAHKAGVLSVSGINPFYAYLSELKLKCTPVDDYVEYSFTFIESADYKYQENSTAPNRYAVKQGEDLWDISCRLNIPIERLISLNLQLKNTYDLSEGDVIRINDI